MTRQSAPTTRRSVLRLSGAVLAATSLAGCSGLTSWDDEGKRTRTTTENEPTTTRSEPIDADQVSLRKRGQIRPSPGSPPGGGYSETEVRDDGRYAILGTKWGTSGSYLVDVSDPTAPEQVHHLDNPDAAPNLDVKFGHRTGLYYRAIERTWPGNFEVVDYGHSAGSPSDPTVVGSVDEGKSHNLTPHPTEPVLYTVNYDLETNGFDAYDLSDPTAPRKTGQYGPQGACHDVNVDPDREVLCAAFQGGEYIGFVLYDVSAPRQPTEIGRFDYDERTQYDQVEIGEEAFGRAHHGHFDPRRDLLYLGDERVKGSPGGKHVFDVGWRDGSLSDPVPVGFTLSPNAQRMNPDDTAAYFDWTGHHFAVVPLQDATLLAAGDWHEGVVLYDVTDPTNPHPVDRYQTDDGTESLTPNDTVSRFGEPPMAWRADYHGSDDRRLVVASDSFTGLYTFELTSGSA
ncbi:hypothetical protein [Halomicrococcus gelatinilyticus]|uniref:hypothetical protein n=1 Tax=Halomicrococcus gelatinilyticus TaxID=1702103 RepID=UPI002E0F6216